jgi:hypothetical protein
MNNSREALVFLSRLKFGDDSVIVDSKNQV